MKRVAFTILLAVVAIAIRVGVSGRAHLAAGNEQLAKQDLFAAAAHYETAARYYLPLSPHVDDAYAHLRELDHAPAIRRAALATASVFTPHSSDLANADAKIAEVYARDPRAGIGAGDTFGDRKSWYAARLSRPTRPSTTLIAVLGIALWVGGAWLLIRRGVDAKGALIRRPAIASMAAIVLGLACWAVGLYNA